MTVHVVLERKDVSDQGTFGHLVGPNFFFFSGELPWRGNTPDISCIPEGRYRGVWTYSPRFHRKVYAIIPVERRSGIRCHSANFMGVSPPYFCQLNGCIALGLHVGTMGGQKALLLSRPAIRQFETTLNGRSFDLEIKNAAG